MKLSPAMKDIYRRLDGLIVTGSPLEQELSVHLIHEIDDFIGRNETWGNLTEESHGTQPVTST